MDLSKSANLSLDAFKQWPKSFRETPMTASLGGPKVTPLSDPSRAKGQLSCPATHLWLHVAIKEGLIGRFTNTGDYDESKIYS